MDGLNGWTNNVKTILNWDYFINANAFLVLELNELITVCMLVNLITIFFVVC